MAMADWRQDGVTILHVVLARGEKSPETLWLDAVQARMHAFDVGCQP
jgi:hypothetical protein